MIEVATLLRQHHAELERFLGVMISISSDAAHRTALDAVALGLEAHAAGESTALNLALDQLSPPPLVYLLASQVTAAHFAQHTALANLTATRRGSAAWRDRANHLRNLIIHHDEHEAACVIPALRDYLPRPHYDHLASCYATARLHSLVAVKYDPSVDQRWLAVS